MASQKWARRDRHVDALAGVCIAVQVVETPKQTGLVCPRCHQPVAVIETESQKAELILFRCPAC